MKAFGVKTSESKMPEMRIYEVNACRAMMFDMLEMKNEILPKNSRRVAVENWIENLEVEARADDEPNQSKIPSFSVKCPERANLC